MAGTNRARGSFKEWTGLRLHYPLDIEETAIKRYFQLSFVLLLLLGIVACAAEAPAT
jgi:hypothetical protein